MKALKKQFADIVDDNPCSCCWQQCCLDYWGWLFFRFGPNCWFWWKQLQHVLCSANVLQDVGRDRHTHVCGAVSASFFYGPHLFWTKPTEMDPNVLSCKRSATWAPPEIRNCLFNGIYWCFHAAILVFFSCGFLVCCNRLSPLERTFLRLPLNIATQQQSHRRGTLERTHNQNSIFSLSSCRVLFFCPFSKLNKSLWVHALLLPRSSLWVM